MRQKIKNGNYLSKYFTQFPNIIDDSGLTPFEFRVLIHYYRVGECWEGVRTTAVKCGMSTGKVAEVRKSLEEKGFIAISPDGDGVSIEVIDKTKENLDKYTNRSSGEQSVHVMNEGVHVVNTNRSSGEHKNNPLRITIEEPIEVETSGELFSAISKKGKGTKEVDPNYKPFVKAWCERYPILGFNATSGKKIKELIEDTRAVLIKRELVPTDEKMIESFRYVLDYVRDSNHFIHGKVITTFQQQYRSVMNEITNGGKKQQRSGGDSAGKQILEQVYNITTTR
jgi:DNA-binding MarR family transcriptional regulator